MMYNMGIEPSRLMRNVSWQVERLMIQGVQRTWMKLPVAVRAVLGGLAIVAVGVAPWSALAGANLRVASSFPWAAIVGLVYLTLVWNWLSDWQQSGSQPWVESIGVDTFLRDTSRSHQWGNRLFNMGTYLAPSYAAHIGWVSLRVGF
jgi:hypothetical protein